MSGEGKFFTTLGLDSETYIPGGIDTPGVMKFQPGNFIRENFDTLPLCVAKLGAGAATGTGGDENLMKLNYSTFEYHMIGTQTIVAPSYGTNGLNVSLDQTNNDGAEFCLGINALNKGVFTVGTDAAFYAKMKFSIADVSGFDECAFGFRKVEAYQASLDDYDEMACLNSISGDINIETIINGGANVTTDTTLNFADLAIHEFEVRVSAAGVVTYKVDGMTPGTVAAYTFDDAEVVVPFFYFRHDSDVGGDLSLISFECGLQ
ncbi:MAG: hypothetical protein GY861_16735 [bacterium]|nr:hypothetical protein [bacterium]